MYIATTNWVTRESYILSQFIVYQSVINIEIIKKLEFKIM